MGIISGLGGFGTWILDWIAPPRCALCGAHLGCSAWCGLLCDVCRPRVPPPQRAARWLAGVPLHTPYQYSSPLGEVIKQFKFSGHCELAHPLARVLSQAIDNISWNNNEWLVPVPLHPNRLAQRGYNQSALLAKALATELRRTKGLRGVRVAPTALRRTVETAQQARLNRAERITNIQGAIEVRSACRVFGRRMILVDDVVTTGATAAACITSLGEVGAQVVAVIAVCAGGSHMDPNEDFTVFNAAPWSGLEGF